MIVALSLVYYIHLCATLSHLFSFLYIIIIQKHLGQFLHFFQNYMIKTRLISFYIAIFMNDEESPMKGRRKWLKSRIWGLICHVLTLFNELARQSHPDSKMVKSNPPCQDSSHLSCLQLHSYNNSLLKLSSDQLILFLGWMQLDKLFW